MTDGGIYRHDFVAAAVVDALARHFDVKRERAELASAIAPTLNPDAVAA